MKVLITGASGHIGKSISAKLAAAHELVLVTRSPFKPVNKAVTVVADVTDVHRMNEVIITHAPDVVIHLAAVLGGACQNDPEGAYKVNVAATESLAKAAAAGGVRDFIFASTAAVYNQTVLEPTDEAHNVDPKSVYGQTKLQAEQALAQVAANSTTRFTALRVFNVYGPGFDQSLVHRLIHSRQDAPVPLFGFDDFYRDYVHVNDVVRAFTAFDGLQKLQGFTVMNIASGKATNNADLVAQLTALGATPSYTVQDAPASYSWANIGRAAKALGFAPQAAIQLD